MLLKLQHVWESHWNANIVSAMGTEILLYFSIQGVKEGLQVKAIWGHSDLKGKLGTWRKFFSSFTELDQ